MRNLVQAGFFFWSNCNCSPLLARAFPNRPVPLPRCETPLCQSPTWTNNTELTPPAQSSHDAAASEATTFMRTCKLQMRASNYQPKLLQNPIREVHALQTHSCSKRGSQSCQNVQSKTSGSSNHSRGQTPKKPNREQTTPHTPAHGPTQPKFHCTLEPTQEWNAANTDATMNATHVCSFGPPKRTLRVCEITRWMGIHN